VLFRSPQNPKTPKPLTLNCNLVMRSFMCVRLFGLFNHWRINLVLLEYYFLSEER